MQNNFIPDAIDIVSRAISADNSGDYPTALNLYRDALSRFTIGLKYEKNESRKKLILERVEGYMKRAEELRDYLNKQAEIERQGGGNGGGGSAGGAGTKKKGEEDDADAEKQKLRGALSGAVVTEKPNVKWDDVAGLQMAKESLKETVILPTRFPQLFTGKRRPFKGILLYGPPGTGKSYLAKAVATEADSTFFSVSSADLVSKWQGESERLVRKKRVYIPLPEPEARAIMVKLHLGDTPNNLSESDFDTLGRLTEGASGSDIKVLVKEALMEPLRRCQQAQQFLPVGDHLMPCEQYPNCPYCPPKLSSDPKNKDYTCKKCKAIRMQLWDVPPEKLKAPDVSVKDFETVMRHSVSSVSKEELEKYTEWTKQFGQEGA